MKTSLKKNIMTDMTANMTIIMKKIYQKNNKEKKQANYVHKNAVVTIKNSELSEELTYYIDIFYA